MGAQPGSILSSFALSAVFDLTGDDFIPQQDNCSIHVATSSLNLLEEKGIALLDWLARSLDLNIIENVLLMLSEIVYDGPQTRSLE